MNITKNRELLCTFVYNDDDDMCIPKKIIDKTSRIIRNLDIQPTIYPTVGKTILLWYEKNDKSCLLFNIKNDKISMVETYKRNYKKAISKNVIENEINDIVNNFHRK